MRIRERQVEDTKWLPQSPSESSDPRNKTWLILLNLADTARWPWRPPPPPRRNQAAQKRWSTRIVAGLIRKCSWAWPVWTSGFRSSWKLRWPVSCLSKHQVINIYLKERAHTIHCTTLHYIAFHHTTLHYTALHYTRWHCSTVQTYIVFIIRGCIDLEVVDGCWQQECHRLP